MKKLHEVRIFKFEEELTKEELDELISSMNEEGYDYFDCCLLVFAEYRFIK